MTPRLADDDIVHDKSQGLRLYGTLRGDTEIFRAFFSGYDRAFVLPDEKEDETGFLRCLELNYGDANRELERRYGPFRELCVVAHDRMSGEQVGGANFIAQPHGPWTTANLNYIYVDENARGRGYFKRLSRSIPELVRALFPAGDEVFIFIEQNDPFSMSPEAYERDTRFTGLDQFDRLRIWARAGARVVDFPYVQPALSSGQQPDASLLYSVYGTRRSTLDASLLRAHLRGFFGISVLKGASLNADPAASRQIESLQRKQSIALLDPLPILSRVRNLEAARSLWMDLPPNFRSVLRDGLPDL